MSEKSRRDTIEEIDCWAENLEADVVLLGSREDRHEYADAIVGVVSVPKPAVVYLRSKVIEVFEKQGMSYNEAEEWYEYNTVRSMPYMRDNPPILVDDI